MPVRLVVIAVLIVAAEVARAEEPCNGFPVADVTLVGCVLEGQPLQCGRPEVAASLVLLLDMPPGTTWSEALVRRGQERLLATGYFATVASACAVDASGAWAEVRFEVTPNRRIRHVGFSGNAALYDSDLLKRLSLRPGAVWSGDTPTGKAERERQEATLSRRYAKEGFAETKATIRPVITGPESVDVIVEIVEGKRSKVGGIDVTVAREVGDPAAGPFGAGLDCPSFTPRVLRQASGLDGNEAFTERRRREAERTLTAWLRARGVLDPAIAISHEPETERTAIAVRFERCAIVRILERDEPAPGRDGYRIIEDDTRLAALTFGEASSIDLDESELSRATLELHYQQLGFLFANVELDFRASDRPILEPGVRAIATFLVTTHWPKEIRGLTLTGELGLPETELLEIMKTKVYDFFGAGGYLLVDQFFADLDAVRRKLIESGYFAVRFPRARPEARQRDVLEIERSVAGGVDIYDYFFADMHFRARQPKGENVLYLEAVIDSGEPSRVGQVDVAVFELDSSGEAPTPQTGEASGIDIADLRTRFVVLPRDPFSGATVAQDLATIEAAFQERGHYDLSVVVACQGRKADGTLETNCGVDGVSECSEENCDYRTVHAARVDLTYKITPGAAYRVGEVFVIGLDRTAESLVRSILPTPGSRLSRLAVDDAGRKLRLLGVFSDVQLRLIGLDEPARPEQIALVAELHEAQDRFLDLSTGIQTLVVRDDERGVPEVGGAVSSSLGAVDSIGAGPTQATPLQIPNFLNVWGIAYRDVNFLGRALELELPLKYGLSLPEDAGEGDAWADALSRYVELRPTIYEPRLLGTNLGLRASIFVRYDRATRDVDEFETGASTAIDIPIARHFRVTTTLTASAIASGDDCDTGICALPELLEREDPLAPKVDLDVGATLDYLDNPIHPTRGVALGSRLRYILSRGTDERGATGDIGNFLLWELTLRAVTNIRRYLIVAAYIRYADSSSFGFDANLPSRYRYRLGGISGVRGLADNSVRTFDEAGDPNLIQEGGDSLLMGTIELRLPLLQRDVGGIWLGFFVDWGGLAESLIDFNRESFRLTAGVGLRYLISGIAIRLDVGFNPLRRCEIQTGVANPTCDVGKIESLTQTHFGLLYTF